MKLATTPADEDGPVWMVNLMKYREVADYSDGRESSISGQEADDAYSPLDSLAAVGAAPVFFGDVDQQLLGDDTTWDRVGRREVPDPHSRSSRCSRCRASRNRTTTRTAGMERTIVMGTQPMAMPEPPAGFESVDWADVPHPPTDDDGPVVVVHVLRFPDAGAAHETRRPHARSIRARPARSHSVMACGSTVGSQWRARSSVTDEPGIRSDSTSSPARPHSWPWCTDPARLEAQKDHREVAIADTYTMIVRAGINNLAASIDA